MSGIVNQDNLYKVGLDIVKQISRTQSRRAGVDKAELVSAGTDGVLFAVNHYSGGNFTIFAQRCISKCIKDRIVDSYRDKNKTVSLTNLPESLHPISKNPAHIDHRVDDILGKANQKEREVLKMVMDGFTQEEIAESNSARKHIECAELRKEVERLQKQIDLKGEGYE
jgi:DNA-binding NarL/FixJ family response regulator